jgi:UDP:flavonoid glycosyltransferase YjiC (YdhE family)
MKVSIPTIGTRGDVEPFVALAQEPARAGHSAVVLSDPVMRTLVESHGVPFIAIGPDVDLDEVAASVRRRSRRPWPALAAGCASPSRRWRRPTRTSWRAAVARTWW